MSRYPRYPKYKDSGVEWIGEVPEHWQVVPLKWLATIQNGQDYKGVADVDGDVPVIGSGGEFARASTPLFTGESVLLGRKGTVDKPLYVNGPIWVVDTMFYTRIDGHADGRFVYYAATTIPFERYATNTALPSMTQDDLSSHALAAPAKCEQSAIAHAIDRETTRIDALIAKKSRFIELLKEKRQALITRAVTKGLDPDAAMKDSGVEWIGEVPAHWLMSRVKFVASIGNGSTPSRDRVDYWEGGDFPWLTSSCVNNEYVDEAEEYVTPLAMAECHLPVVQPPAILVGITGQGRTRGMATTLAIEATINQHIAFLKASEARIRTAFLRRCIDTAYEWLRSQSAGNGGTKGAITCEQLGDLSIALPSIGEQDAILTCVHRLTKRIDELLAKTSRSLALLKERRAAFITAAVTGQIDLRDTVPPAQRDTACTP